MKISKDILKKELRALGFKLIGNYIVAKDIDRICHIRAETTPQEIGDKFKKELDWLVNELKKNFNLGEDECDTFIKDATKNYVEGKDIIALLQKLVKGKHKQNEIKVS